MIRGSIGHELTRDEMFNRLQVVVTIRACSPILRVSYVIGSALGGNRARFASPTLFSIHAYIPCRSR